ncbi:LysR family transcriptional regulator [Altericroceibacterium spongiae]|uniref:LysR family transcriptional regulator n=1 Tax=Altericroceibacterium spongiae TaxID=2320269 RepID=A0A420EFG2_9SPHN|nr:LysR family transcriptional regulator [Altericroceibacterium spongiae]RKF19403.1 LysR family transcriptional regulator [Altericroceibacterium spongiae]
MADRLTGMEVFVRAVRLGGLSAAGRAMGISPSMAARHLDALEERLGTRLVNRTTRRLALTDAGQVYLDRAEHVLAEIAEADAEASAQSRTVQGLLRVSAPATFGVMHIAPLAAEFHRLNPGVTIELGLDDRYVDLLEERWDTAIRIGRLSDSSLMARSLAPMRLAICASPAYLAERGTPDTIEDLKDHDCLCYTLSTPTGSAWGFGKDGARQVTVRGSLHANNGEALIRAATAGQGLVYGPRFIAAEAINRGELVEVLLDAEYMDLGSVYAVTHSRRGLSAKIRAWLDFLYDRVPPLAHDW